MVLAGVELRETSRLKFMDFIEAFYGIELLGPKASEQGGSETWLVS